MSNGKNRNEGVRGVCENCKFFEPAMWPGSEGELVGTCLDRSKIIHPEGVVVDLDNLRGVANAAIFTCDNFYEGSWLDSGEVDTGGRDED